jgi:alginate O-acetyltransferase complex protein AlgJ
MIRSRPENLIRSWLFLGMLMIPGIVMLFAPRQDVSQREARVLARQPGLVELAEHPFDYSPLWDAYLKDHFGMRDWLLDLTSVVRWDMKSPASAKVIVGKKGWLFYEEGLLPTSESKQDIEEKVDRQLELIRAISDRLRRQGIPLLVVPTLDKHTLYPEYLPGWLDHRPQNHALDQLIAGIRSRGVDMIDIRDGLAASKDQQPLFFLTDTHWTPIGAALAFNLISGFSHGVLSPVKVPGGARLEPGPPHDLARMAGFDGEPLDWTVPAFNSSYPQAVREELQIADHSLQKPFVMRRDGPGSKVLIVGDSFSGHWPTYALESANTVYWSHHNQCLADWHELLSLKVDLVIYQMLERTIGCPPLGPEIMKSIEAPTG